MKRLSTILGSVLFVSSLFIACSAQAPGGSETCEGGRCEQLKVDCSSVVIAKDDVCDVFSNCGCEGTDKCYPGSEGEPRYCAPPGTVAVGETCKGEGDCQSGAFCPAEGAKCSQICSATVSCTNGATCEMGDSSLGLCDYRVSDACDVFAQDCSKEGQKCILPNATNTGMCYPSTGNRQQGDACEDDIDSCGTGLDCTSWTDSSGAQVSQCAAFCENGNSSCPSETTCQSTEVTGTLCVPSGWTRS